MAKTNYDSQFCGSLPLAFINQVQPYGFLAVTDKQLKVVQVSENISAHLQLSVEEIVEMPLRNLLHQDSWQRLENKMIAPPGQKFTLKLDVRHVNGEFSKHLAIVHLKENYFIFEFEPAERTENGFLEVYQNIRDASSAIQNAPDFQAALGIAANELKRISGFDKVMIYRFDEEWNGHVVAEAMEPHMDSYLGLHFPASDIPKQARELYLKNPFRQIPDREYVAAKLYPVINPLQSGFLDLGECNMRAVVKVHLEYLKNMNVMSSMSTRIIKDNRLWGLISCHHRQAKFLPYDECSAFELLSGIISAKLSSLEIKNDLDITSEQMKTHAKVAEDIYSEKTLRNGVKKTHANMQELLNCSGLAYVADSKISAFGNCPSPDAIGDLVIWLQTRQLNGCYSTNALSEEYDEAKTIIPEASGLVALPVIPDKGEYILGFRSEALREISWGGNPDEAIQFEADKNTYHPRNSFKLWQQEIRGTSRPFSAHEIGSAKEILRLVLGYRVAELNKN